MTNFSINDNVKTWKLIKYTYKKGNVMTEKYVCGICGKSYTDLDEYLDCVSKCGEKFKKERENKRLEEINAAINGVKQAKIYYEQKLKEFKEKYPEEYDMNFGSESSNDCDAKAVKREDIGKIEIRATSDGNGKPKIDARINDKKVETEVINKLFEDPDTKYIAKLLGLV